MLKDPLPAVPWRRTITAVGVVGMGFQFKLNDRFNIAVEDKVTLTTTDLLDGQQWQNNYTGPIASGAQNGIAPDEVC